VNTQVRITVFPTVYFSQCACLLSNYPDPYSLLSTFAFEIDVSFTSRENKVLDTGRMISVCIHSDFASSGVCRMSSQKDEQSFF
jgi:hypothetical protein